MVVVFPHFLLGSTLVLSHYFRDKQKTSASHIFALLFSILVKVHGPFNVVRAFINQRQDLGTKNF